MSPDRVVYSFIVGWVVLIAVMIVLDWLGNPNRGSFRPKGDRPVRDRHARRAERKRAKAESDAAVRAALRDAYGASSLRLTWSRDREDAVRRADDALVVGIGDGSTDADVLDVGSHEVTTRGQTAIIGDPLPNVDERPAEEPQPEESEPDEPEPEPEPAEPDPIVGWSVGVDPLALTRGGTRPTPGTVRARVWKNLAVTGGWDGDNLARLRAGKPPRRRNPITGATETAKVDTAMAKASWDDGALDPFEEQA